MDEKSVGPGDALWNVKDVALYLRASRSWVYKAAEKKVIPSIRVGTLLRFDPAVIRDHFRSPPGGRGR